MDKIKTLFNKLQIDSRSVLLTIKQLNEKVLKKLKKPSYVKDKEFFNLFSLLENKDDSGKDKKVSLPIKATYVGKGDDIDGRLSIVLQYHLNYYMLILQILSF